MVTECVERVRLVSIRSQMHAAAPPHEGMNHLAPPRESDANPWLLRRATQPSVVRSRPPAAPAPGPGQVTIKEADFGHSWATKLPRPICRACPRANPEARRIFVHASSFVRRRRARPRALAMNLLARALRVGTRGPDHAPISGHRAHSDTIRPPKASESSPPTPRRPNAQSNTHKPK